MSGFVYAISSGGDRVKIGYTRDPMKRLAQIRTSCPDAVMVGLIRAIQQQEREAHALLAPWKINGEWFHRIGPVADFVLMLPIPKLEAVAANPLCREHPLRIWRIQARLTLKQVAKYVGVTEMTVWRWEDRRVNPNARQRASLCQLTGMPPAKFIAEAA